MDSSLFFLSERLHISFFVSYEPRPSRVLRERDKPPNDLVAGISICYPWRQEQPFAPKLVHLPLLLIPLWITYEVLMPDYMNIRVDLFLTPPLVLFVIVIWAAKVARFRKLEQKAEQAASPNCRSVK